MSRRNHPRCCFRRVYLPLNCLNLRRLLLRHRFQLHLGEGDSPAQIAFDRRTRCQFLSISSCAGLPIFLARHRDVEDTARLRRRYRELCRKGGFVSNDALDGCVAVTASGIGTIGAARPFQFLRSLLAAALCLSSSTRSFLARSVGLCARFFTYLLIEGILTRADQGKGKLRTYLLTSLQYFVRDQQDRACTLKRGGGQQILSFDEFMLEAEASMMATQHLDDATTYDLTWASSIARRAGKERPRSGRQCTCARFR